jgi:hypothetical protein
MHCWCVVQGTIPVEIGQLSKLIHLNLSVTRLQGSIPPELFNAPQLTSLELESNSLSKSLPSVFSNENLQYISLRNNILTGTISPNLLSLPALRNLDVFNNSFRGKLPLTEGLLCEKLQYLDLGLNDFTGPLPANWSSYRSLQYFYANLNRINGSLPPIYLSGQFKAASISLQVLSLYGNKLTGTISDALWTHTDLQQLLLGNNSLRGQLSRGVTELRSIINLDLSSNAFSGNLESVFVTPFRKIQILNLAANSFVGTIPKNISSSTLRVLALSSNCFSGTIPDTICLASGMQTLLLNTLSSGNADCWVPIPQFLKQGIQGIIPTKRMDGPIPACLFNLSNLTTMHISGNLLKNKIADTALSRSITDLQLSYNALTGTVPTNFQTSGQFVTLALQNNMLSGILSADFVVGSQLNTLNLSVNRISGSIPPSISEVPNPDILAGNWFACSFFAQLPANDPNKDLYSCGSNQFDIAIIAWAICLFVLVSILIIGSVLLKDIEDRITSDQETVSGERSSVEMRGSEGVSFCSVEEMVPPQQLHGIAISAAHRTALQPTEIVVKVHKTMMSWLGYNFSGNQLLVSTEKFCKALVLMCRRMGIAAALFVLCMLFYITLKLAFHGNYVTVSNQQLWLSTSLFLSGYLPAVVLLVIVLGILGQAIFLVDINQLQSIESQRSILKELERLNQHYRKRFDRFSSKIIDFYFVPSALHLVNLVVAVTVNAVYVENLPRVPPSYVLLFQAAVSTFKIAWVNFYIPVAMRQLHRLSTISRFQSQVTMLLVNYLIGPAVATAGANNNCLYFAIRGMETVVFQYSFSVPRCSPTFYYDLDTRNHSATVHVDGVNCDYSYSLPQSVDSKPPLMYSYQCGFSFVVDYVPVLLYSYLMAAVIIPAARLFLLYSSQTFLRNHLWQWLYNAIIPGTIHDFDGLQQQLRSTTRNSLTDSFRIPMSRPNSVESTTTEISELYVVPLFDGSFVIAQLLVDVAVMMTFGLACPLLAVMVAVAVFLQSVIWRLMIGKFLCTVASQNTLAFTRLERSFGDGIQHGTIGGMRIVVLAVSSFWSVLFFDYVGDKHGPSEAFIFAIVCFVSIPLYCSALFNYRGWADKRTLQASEQQSSTESPFGLAPVPGNILASDSNSKF